MLYLKAIIYYLYNNSKALYYTSPVTYLQGDTKMPIKDITRAVLPYGEVVVTKFKGWDVIVESVGAILDRYLISIERSIDEGNSDAAVVLLTNCHCNSIMAVRQELSCAVEESGWTGMRIQKQFDKSGLPAQTWDSIEEFEEETCKARNTIGK